MDNHLIYYQRFKSLEERFWEKVDKKLDDECWNWLAFLNEDGYGKFRIRKNEAMIGAHRASWIIHFGEIPEGLQVLHHCDNPACVNPKHLFLGTHLDNMEDRTRKGRNIGFKGDENPNSKLSKDDVRLLRESYVPGYYNCIELADRFGISVASVYRIVGNRGWKHIKESNED